MKDYFHNDETLKDFDYFAFKALRESKFQDSKKWAIEGINYCKKNNISSEVLPDLQALLAFSLNKISKSPKEIKTYCKEILDLNEKFPFRRICYELLYPEECQKLLWNLVRHIEKTDFTNIYTQIKQLQEYPYYYSEEIWLLFGNSPLLYKIDLFELDTTVTCSFAIFFFKEVEIIRIKATNRTLMIDLRYKGMKSTQLVRFNGYIIPEDSPRYIISSDGLIVISLRKHSCNLGLWKPTVYDNILSLPIDNNPFLNLTPLQKCSNFYQTITMKIYGEKRFYNVIDKHKRFHIGFYPCAVEKCVIWNSGEGFENQLATYLQRQDNIFSENNSVYQKKARELVKKFGKIGALTEAKVPFLNDWSIPEYLKIMQKDKDPNFIQYHPFEDKTGMGLDQEWIKDTLESLEFYPTMEDFQIQYFLQAEWGGIDEPEFLYHNNIPEMCLHFLPNDEHQVSFLYLLGHGINKETINNIKSNKKLTSYYQAFFEEFFMTIEENPNQILDGSIIHTVNIISLQKIVDDFISRVNQNNYQNKHLIIVLDSCFSGNSLNQISGMDYTNITKVNCQITIQSACNNEEVSYGNCFAPLFRLLQSFDQKQLEKLIDQFSSILLPDYFEEFTFFHQHPRLFSTIDKLLKHDNPIVTIDSVRLFSNPNFFLFLQSEFPSILFINDFEKNLKERLFLRHDELITFFHVLESDSKSVKVKIQVVKLIIYSNQKPEALVCFKWPKGRINGQTINNTLCSLHIHFDGTEPYPGKQTSWKLLSCSLVDKSIQDTDTAYPISNTPLPNKFIEQIEMFLATGAKEKIDWTNKSNWTLKKSYSASDITYKNRNFCLLNATEADS